MDSNRARVLSIQSHVVSGYVGNKCATFPLQLLGIEIDTINTVQLSNHTRYKVWKGQILDNQDLENLMEGLEPNGLDNYTHILTGYVGSPSFLKSIARVVKKLKKKNPNLMYVCDPVMGDNGHLYVPEAFTEIYPKEIIPLADIVTPNQFELEILTGKPVKTVEDIKSAMKVLQKLGPKVVTVSSANIEEKLEAFVYSVKNNQILSIEIPNIPLLYTGSGDLYAALFLAHMHLESDLKTVLEKTINSVHNVLLRTLDYYKAHSGNDAEDVKNRELRLIDSKNDIENPEIRLRATAL